MNTYAQWTLPTTDGIHSLELDENIPVSSLPPLGDGDVLVNIKAAALNYRELVIAKGTVPGTIKPSIVPCSDGSGIVQAVGKDVSDFKPGDQVLTHMCPHIPSTQPPLFPEISAGLGQNEHGTLRQLGTFHHSALVPTPANVSHEEGCTLTCSGLTAYNALFGLRGKEVKAGDWVLVQGTGGVSIAALQFAVAAGANVVATTSSKEKAERLKGLGAREVVNYRTDSSWGITARTFTPENCGFDLIVDIAGDESLPQSLAAIRADGAVVVAGILGDSAAETVPMLGCLWQGCIVRGLFLGARQQFREMVKFVEEKDVHPIVDEKVFEMKEARQAFEYLEQRKHFSKVVIRVS
ncbi:hypothetical protein LTR78_010673 [Recurvomyces mirabilis]|uniref:Enoyl reductase (ER) domain-containing protein n=1 Tax=Recurvomyces mirabilis TaxID=574656 RepID=A0AAE0TQ18_9PEZI|nr:hypothetical protein LTR78_010673 [Recurvomyces mirabilis]KAK5149531.1 hypothetical protein LTS14_010857 [Recurvomyces mirabilis]